MGGEEPGMLRGEQVVVRYDPSLKAAAEEVIAVFPRIRARLEVIFGWDLGLEPVVLLIGDRARFQQMAGTPLVAAYALPHIAGIVIDQTRMGVRPFALDITLQHELCHLLLHRHIEDSRLPAWLDEGVCQWASDGINEIIMEGRRSPLVRASLRNRFLPLRKLEDRFPRQAEELVLAYAESKAFVNFLIGLSGKEGILAVLGHLRRGGDADSALRMQFGLGVEALEKRWHETLRETPVTLVLVSYYLYEIVFALGAILALYGFVRAVMRKRAYRKEMDDGDGIPPG